MTDSVPRRRAWNVTLWVLQIVAATAFVLVAAAKFTGAQLEVTTFHAIGLGDWFRYLVGGLEIAGAAGLLVPRLAGLAGLALAGLMVGAVLTQLLVIGSGVAMPLPFLAVCCVIAWGRRDRTAALWALISRGRR